MNTLRRRKCGREAGVVVIVSGASVANALRSLGAFDDVLMKARRRMDDSRDRCARGYVEFPERAIAAAQRRQSSVP
jgi:hypothetical protein